MLLGRLVSPGRRSPAVWSLLAGAPLPSGLSWPPLSCRLVSAGRRSPAVWSGVISWSSGPACLRALLAPRLAVVALAPERPSRRAADSGRPEADPAGLRAMPGGGGGRAAATSGADMIKVYVFLESAGSQCSSSSASLGSSVPAAARLYWRRRAPAAPGRACWLRHRLGVRALAATRTFVRDLGFFSETELQPDKGTGMLGTEFDRLHCIIAGSGLRTNKRN